MLASGSASESVSSTTTSSERDGDLGEALVAAHGRRALHAPRLGGAACGRIALDVERRLPPESPRTRSSSGGRVHDLVDHDPRANAARRVLGQLLGKQELVDDWP